MTKIFPLLRNVFGVTALAFGLSELTEPWLKKNLRSVYRGIKGYAPNETTIEDDPDGVPWVNYGQFQGVWVGRQRNPVTICQRAFAYEQAYRQGDLAALKKLIHCADWLVDHAIISGDFAVYEYANPWYYNLTPPWRSAMANGQALQVLVRAHKITVDERYLTTARSLLRALQTPVEQGGLTYQTEDGWWFEEYICSDGSQPRVLNGMIFTWLGIREYFDYTADPAAQILLQQGLRAIKARLPDYNRPNGYSSYDALGQPAGEYHAIHVDLLNQLYQLTAEPLFRQYRDLWAAYRGRLESPFIIRLLKKPSLINIAVLTANLLFAAGLFSFWQRFCRRQR